MDAICIYKHENMCKILIWFLLFNILKQNKIK